MPVPNPPLRRQPLSSLATKIVSVVFLSTFLTAFVVSAIAVYSAYGFLRGRIEESYPLLLTGTSEQILSRLDEGGIELERLAAEPALHRALRGASPERSAEETLNEALLRTAFFDALLLVDSSGESVAAVARGDAPPPPALLQALAPEAGAGATHAISDAGELGAPVAVVSVAGGGEVLGTLCGVFHRAGLRELLAPESLGGRGELFLIDGSGKMRLGPPEAQSLEAALGAEWLEDASGEVRLRRSDSTGWVVGAALPLGALDWTLVVEQPFAEAFQPMFWLLTRLLVIDLCVILLFGLLARKVSATIAQPIEALSEGARRISQGELDLEIPSAEGNYEIGLLIRTFNDMTRKHLRDRTEIQQVNRKLLAQNDELQRANEVLEQLSITDGLTKLHNHRFFQEHLGREIKRVDRSGEPLSLLMMDIDDFKQLNDHFGHQAGDELLVGLAGILNQSMRDSDLVARYGGEEFAVLAANTDLTGAANLGEKIRTAVAEAAFIVGDSMRPTRMTISIGVAQYRGSRKQLFRRADRALYHAKSEGKDCVVTEEVDPAFAGPGAPARDS
jgi:diguanylate cyclase (GGDEF)-like protein